MLFFSRKPASSSIVRFLHDFSRSPRPEVVIANNSGLFFTYASINKHGRKAHSDLKIIIPEFWLDKVDPKYNSLDWGQTLSGIPWFLQKEFIEACPNHREGNYISWGEYRNFREHIKKKLANMNIPIYEGVPQIKKQDNGDAYRMITQNGEFDCSPGTHFYNSFRVHETNHGLSNFPIGQPHTSIYNESSTHPTIVALGSGRSVIWLAQHHPESMVLCIANKKLPWFKGETPCKNLLVLNTDMFETDYEIKPVVNSNGNGKFVEILEKNSNKVFFNGEFCVAIGLKPQPKITEDINKKHKTVMTKNSYKWYSPENIPRGSLLEATLEWARLTRNLDWSYELYAFHENNRIIKTLIATVEKKGINFKNNFFSYLKNEVAQLKNAPKSSEELSEIYIRAHNKSGRSISPAESKQLGDIIINMENQRNNNDKLKHVITRRRI